MALERLFLKTDTAGTLARAYDPNESSKKAIERAYQKRFDKIPDPNKNQALQELNMKIENALLRAKTPEDEGKQRLRKMVDRALLGAQP